jgi:hypothetical protein
MLPAVCLLPEENPEPIAVRIRIQRRYRVGPVESAINMAANAAHSNRDCDRDTSPGTSNHTADTKISAWHNGCRKA